MCVQTLLKDQGNRITALEAKHNTPEDLAIVKAQIEKINVFLFGSGCVPDVPRDKSNVVKS